jgi:threonine/homoserine/homoserine lactone efflux protein
METSFLMNGLVAGFVLCAPLGPVGVVCLRNALRHGGMAGFYSILGAAVVDALYGLVAGLGMSVIGGLLDQTRIWFQLGGAAFIMLLGLRLISAAAEGNPARRLPQKLGSFLATFSLTLSNPLPILAISAALSAATRGRLKLGVAEIQLFASGVFLGSLAWSPILAAAAARMAPLIEPGGLVRLNRLCGAALLACGLCLGLVPFLPPSL